MNRDPRCSQQPLRNFIGLQDAADRVAIPFRDVKTPITIPSRYRTGNAATIPKRARRHC